MAHKGGLLLSAKGALNLRILKRVSIVLRVFHSAEARGAASSACPFLRCEERPSLRVRGRMDGPNLSHQAKSKGYTVERTRTYVRVLRGKSAIALARLRFYNMEDSHVLIFSHEPDELGCLEKQ